MRFFALLSVACLLVIPVARADVAKLPGIKGADDRQFVESAAWPWSAIGRVNRSGGSFCTGTLIAKDRVLTAAHCLWDERGKRWLPPAMIHFVAGYSRAEYVAHARVASYTLSSEEPIYGVLKQARNDWVVLTLAEALGETAGFIEIRPLTVKTWTAWKRDGGVLLRAGYSQDKGHILSRHSGCALTRFWNSEDTVFHDCDATRGDSGSPLLIRRGTRYHLIGIHVATATIKGIPTGIAVSSHRFYNRVGAQ